MFGLIIGGLDRVYGDVDIEGYLRNDSVPVYGVITGNYCYSYRAPRYEKDGWGVNLTGLNLSSPGAFGKSFMNAAKSAITGYLAAKTAQKLGAGDFVSSLVGSLASAWASETNEGLTSQGHISETHNDKELEIELVGFNKEQFNAEMTQIKQTIFNEAVDDGVPQAVAQKIAEDKVTEIERDVATFKKKAEKVRELVEKARKSEAKGKNVVEENTRSSADDTAVNWLLNPPFDEASTSGARMSELFHEVIREKGNLTPREEMLAYVPKNETEKALKETTLLRYEAEDLIAKHPDAADLCGKIFIGAMYGLQGAEYAGAAVVGATKGAALGTAVGPVGTVAGGAVGATAAVAGKYASQEAISYAIDTTIEESSSKAVEGMAVSPALREEFKTTLKVSAYTTLCAGSVKASKKLVKTLAKSAKKGVLQKTFTQTEMKELLSSKANDNFWMNDNNVYMSKGKVVGGENFDVGTVSSNIDGGVPGSRVSVKPYNSQTAMDKKIDVLKKKSVESKDHKLLPGECEVGTYGELIARGEKWDNLTPDHIPSAAYMKKHFGVSKKDGVAMNMEHPHPGTGGRHRQSRTYGKPATDNPLKTEIYLDVSNRIDIYKKEGLYGSKVRKGLLNVIEENRKRFPEEFKKKK